MNELERENSDTLGRIVRQAWVRWAQAQPNPKTSWLVPWEDLPESDREADRRIGEALWGHFLGTIPGTRPTFSDHGKPEITDDQIRLLRIIADPCSGIPCLFRRDQEAVAAADREIRRLRGMIERMLGER